ncbi:hypothetical protein MKW98_020361, partial [Papaver atlanticum]
YRLQDIKMSYACYFQINVGITNELGSLLLYAAAHGYHDTVEVLLDLGANPNLVFHDALTALHSSIRSQSLLCMVSLLKAGADPNGGPDGKPLTIAAELGVIQIIELLVEAGADPNVTDIDNLSIYLDLGGQFEIGGATLETLHQELVRRLIQTSTRRNSRNGNKK